MRRRWVVCDKLVWSSFAFLRVDFSPMGYHTHTPKAKEICSSWLYCIKCIYRNIVSSLFEGQCHSSNLFNDRNPIVLNCWTKGGVEHMKYYFVYEKAFPLGQTRSQATSGTFMFDLNDIFSVNVKNNLSTGESIKIWIKNGNRDNVTHDTMMNNAVVVFPMSGCLVCCVFHRERFGHTSAVLRLMLTPKAQYTI